MFYWREIWFFFFFKNTISIFLTCLVFDCLKSKKTRFYGKQNEHMELNAGLDFFKFRRATDNRIKFYAKPIRMYETFYRVFEKQESSSRLQSRLTIRNASTVETDVDFGGQYEIGTLEHATPGVSLAQILISV